MYIYIFIHIVCISKYSLFMNVYIYIHIHRLVCTDKKYIYIYTQYPDSNLYGWYCFRSPPRKKTWTRKPRVCVLGLPPPGGRARKDD